ncbi:wax ester/triacylglycerol synthase family O-acyltransferase [Amycolatopsis sp. QT-25]|uniref:wax ester/triacylglycerol synthase domain-containing protein n=1 Tax=Amycolatopsis sp. QT-25 TaxID=3034022 RepID=UPI0023EBD0F6|nr:wax ester/triacylglycerol synthase domain-containing protein [Amycolatopsis sp. QT-25]WET82461.1 wax ester/triacylglycerol synthase family O-acyltransferase [Amycolatopsis sp. QT-25]
MSIIDGESGYDMNSSPFRHLSNSVSWGAVREMNAVETMFWRVDSSAGVEANLLGLLLLDRAPDWERLVDRHQWVVRAAPLLRKRLVEPPLHWGRPFWADDPAFDVTHHLRRVRLPSPGSRRQLLDFAQTLSMSPFSPARPLWEAVLVEGVDGHGAAYLLKIHHSLTDGTGASQLVYLLVDAEAEPAEEKLLPPMPPNRRADNRTLLVAGRFARMLGRLRPPRAPWKVRHRAAPAVTVLSSARRNGAAPRSRRPPDVAALLGMAKSFAHATVLPSAPPAPLLAGRSRYAHFEMVDVPFAALRAAGKACGGTFNDAYLAGLAGAFDRYHRRFGLALDILPALLPISVRRPGAVAGGNHLASTRLVLPVGGRTPAERVGLIHDAVTAVREGPTLHALGLLSRPITPLPPSVVGRITKEMFRDNDLLASNFAGIPQPVYLAGVKVVAIQPYAPLLRGAVSVALVSYVDQAQMGVNLDTGAITEPEVFVRCLRESFEEVIGLASRQEPARGEPTAQRGR